MRELAFFDETQTMIGGRGIHKMEDVSNSMDVGGVLTRPLGD